MLRYDPFDGCHVRAKKNGITETVKQGFYLFVFFFQFKEEIKVVFSFHIFLFHIYFFPGWKPFQQLQRQSINFNNHIIISNSPDCQQPVDWNYTSYFVVLRLLFSFHHAVSCHFVRSSSGDEDARCASRGHWFPFRERSRPCIRNTVSV